MVYDLRTFCEHARKIGGRMADSARLTSANEAELAELRVQLAAKDEELRQAELLMREVNHRVANSLQLASSILRMQAHQETEAHTRDQLEKAGLRINSIQHVHDRLYRSGDMRTIEFSQYLRDLCNDLSDSVLQDDKSKVFNLAAECDRMRVQTDIASKLGLVVNELVTNAFKHGHCENEDCMVRVVARLKGDVLVIEVSDNGPGLPEGFDIARPRGLGMRLVRFVAGSLGGECGARNGSESGKPGSVFFVTIPLPV
jgi:two-component sensor histidine kinase